MSKFAVLLFILANCASGCRHVARLEVKDIPSAPCPTAAPTTSTQRESVKVAPEAVQAEKSLARPNKAEKEPISKTPTPANYLGQIASSQKDPICDSVQLRANVGASKAAEQTPTLTVESKPASAPEIDVAKEIPKNHFKTPTTAFPRDFWYGIATVIGAVFTYILAPVVVDIIKGRMASARNPADARRPITT